MDRTSEHIGVLAALSAGIIWGLLGLFVRGLDEMGVSPMQMTCLRYIIVTLFLLAYVLVKDRGMLRSDPGNIWIFLLMGVVGTILNSVCYFASMSMISLSLAAVLQYTSPFIVILLSVPALNEKLTRMKILSVVGAFIGCVLCTGVLTAPGEMDVLGVLLGAFSGLCFAIYTVGSKVAYSKGCSVPTVLFYTSLICCVGLAPFCDLPGAVSLMIVDRTVLWMVLGSGIFVTLLPFVLFNSSLKRIEAGKASTITYVEIVAATVVGFLVYKEGVTVDSVIGMLLILAALVAIGRTRVES